MTFNVCFALFPSCSYSGVYCFSFVVLVGFIACCFLVLSLFVALKPDRSRQVPFVG